MSTTSRLFLFCLLFIYPSGAWGSLAMEGAESSGGGLLLHDRTNPWWVQNTTEVRYCVDIDEASFSLDRATAESSIAKAFGYWKKQFSAAISGEPNNGMLEKPNNRVQVATQNFVQSPCDDSVDLRFQLGRLLPQQETALGDSSSIVGITVRTSYDRQNIRGKGYIYIAADIGPKRHPEFSKDFNPWDFAEGRFFYATVVHELGHVFGLPHLLTKHSIMGHTFVERFVLGNDYLLGAAILIDFLDSDAIFRVDAKPGDCWCICAGSCPDTDQRARRSSQRNIKMPDSVEQVFGIKATIAANEMFCRKESFENDTFLIETGRECSAMKVVGQAKMKVLNEDRSTDFVTLWIPPEHSGFFQLREGERRRVPVVGLFTKTLKGDFVISATGKRTPISFELSPGEYWPPRISAAVSGQLITDVLAGE